ncbi:MAG TPA: ABC transporter permease [Anaerolineaceae bacterium]|uniref:Putative ABC transporter permease protein n=1 Tax=Anaerolinea thermophila TaxID=167964 RepID=A0A101FY39_9CHLR|nr:MAG: Putative ABC transporter permease protein [Anaerolinea thermophila]HAF62107.1 ABC transporter permease [Anaerolineaceae bacterium]
MKTKFINGVLGIVIALMLGAIVMWIQGYAPFETYTALFNYSLGSFYSFTTMLRNSVPLILTGLSASVAFASGPVNLGQPGQFLMGALLATIGGLYLDLPPILMIPILILLAMLGGALWSGLAGLMRLWFKMDEFITTLMLNMIADFFTYWAISYPLFDKEAYSPMTPAINPNGWLPEFGNFNTNIIVMILAFIAVWFISKKTVAGYEWRIAGQNSLFARLGGCEIDKNYLKVMLLTGALAGLAGGLVVMAGPHRFLKGLGANYAWDGVMIAMVANNGILATLLYGLFFSILQTGALGMELITDVPREFIMVIQAVIVLVVVAGRGYFNILMDKIAVRRKAKEGLE